MSYDLQKAARIKHVQEMGTALNSKISSVYKPAGSVIFTGLPTPDKDHLGYVYNVTDAFVTTASFVEGAGQSHPAGTNVAIVVGETDGTYLFDVLAGFVDLSGYAKTTDVSKVTASSTNGCISVDGSDVTVVEFATDEEFAELMNDMFGTTA